MRLGIKLYVAIRCGYCRRRKGHKEDCPIQQLLELEACQKQDGQFQCGCGGICNINTSDFYECRTCRTQYSRQTTAGSEMFFAELGEADLTMLSVIGEKGHGEFKWDVAIQQLRDILAIH